MPFTEPDNVPPDLFAEVLQRLESFLCRYPPTSPGYPQRLVEATLDTVLHMSPEWIHGECMPREDYVEVVEDATKTEFMLTECKKELEAAQQQIALLEREVKLRERQV